LASESEEDELEIPKKTNHQMPVPEFQSASQLGNLKKMRKLKIGKNFTIKLPEVNMPPPKTTKPKKKKKNLKLKDYDLIE